MNLFESVLSKKANLEIENDGLKSSLCRKDLEISKLVAQVKFLKERVAEFTRAEYGRRSEGWKPSEAEQGVFNEVEFEATQNIEIINDENLDVGPTEEVKVVDVPAHKKAKGHRKALPKYLPREKVVIELPANERVDAEGNRLVVIGYEISEKLHYEPAKSKVLEIHRAKYGADAGDYVKTAPPEPAIIPKGIATPSLLSAIAVAKYADGMPLYRIEESFKRQEIDLNRSTMARWMIKVSEAATPLINELSDRMFESPYISCDETKFQVLKENGKAAESQSWMFVRATPSALNRVVLFDYTASRSGEFTKNLFAEYRGTVQTDGLNIYNLFSEIDEINHLGCNMHGRRYFEKAFTLGAKDGKSLAEQGLKFYKELYDIEEEIREHTESARFLERLNRAKPIWDKMREWSLKNTTKVPPESRIGKAFSYFNSEFEHLKGYLGNGAFEMDNGFVERAIRKFAIGRNNWLFSDTVAGAHASACLYSLTVTAKINNVNPFNAFKYIFTELPKAKKLQDYQHLADVVMGITPVPIT